MVTLTAENQNSNSPKFLTAVRLLAQKNAMKTATQP